MSSEYNDPETRSRFQTLKNENKHIEGQKITNQVAQLRRIRNFSQNQDFQVNKELINKNFLEDFIKNSRLILNQVRKVYIIQNIHTNIPISLSLIKQQENQNGRGQIVEFAILSIHKHLIMNLWILIVYIPKTCRKLISYITTNDLVETQGNKVQVFQPIYLKEQIKNNVKLMEAVNFIQFQKICEKTRQQQLQSLRSTSFIIARQNKQPSQNRRQQEPDERQGSLEEKNKRNQSKKNTIKLDEQLSQLKIQSGFNISEMMQEFFNLTDYITDKLEYTVHTFIIGEDKQMCYFKFLEKQIWFNIMNMLMGFQLNLKKENEKKYIIPVNGFLSLNLGTRSLQMDELITGHYLKIEMLGEAYVDFFIKYDIPQKIFSPNQSPLPTNQHSPSISSHETHQNRGLSLLKEKMNLKTLPLKLTGLVQGVKEQEDQIRFIKKINVFQPFDPISYALSSNFNLELKYYSYNQLETISQSVNLREMLNLYIADGYYKYQTTYMNSKLNLADLHNISFYVLHKIKTQNFLNLSQYHVKRQDQRPSILPTKIDIKNLSQKQLSSSTSSSPSSNSSQELPLKYTFLQKLQHSISIEVITIRVYLQTQAVSFQRLDIIGYVSIEHYTFNEISMCIPFFDVLMESCPKIALHRLKLAFNLISRVIKPKIQVNLSILN